MAIPAGISTSTVTFGVPVTFQGDQVPVTAVVAPSANITHIATGTPLLAFMETTSPTVGAQGSFILPQVNQSGFQDDSGAAIQNWYYTVTLKYQHISDTKTVVKIVQPQVGQTTIDLDLVGNGVALTPWTGPAAVVTSLGGLTGPVTPTGGTAGAPVLAFQTRHDTAAGWTLANPVLAVGERGYESDTKKCKIGDGSTAWGPLPYEAIDDARLAAAVQTGTTATQLNATYAKGDLAPLQPRGLTVQKVGVVLTPGTAAFEAFLVESPCVVWDPATQQLVMVYVGYSNNAGAAGNASVGLATSLDGVNWTRTGVPVIQGTGLAGDPDQYGTTAPYLWIENGTYYLYYVGLDQAGYEAGTKRMCLATATSINGPWTRKGPQITPSSAGTGWRTNAIYHPNVVKHTDGKYYMFFNALGIVGGVSGERIGYATATSMLGPWTVDDTNSPLMPLGAGGTWDSYITGDPSLYRVGDYYFMAYFGSDNVNPAQDGVAFTKVSSFPLGWTKHPSNPILTPGPTGSYDDSQAHKPFILQTPGAIYHYYTAVGTAQPRQIALAIDSPTTVAGNLANPSPTVDSFIRANSATSLGAAPNGKAWRNDVGVWGVTGNQAYAATLASSEAVASIDSGLANCAVSARLVTVPTSGQALGLIARMVSGSLFIWAEVTPTSIALNKRNFGDTAIIAAVTRTIAAGDIIKVLCYGTTLILQHNGVTIGKVTDTFAQTGTRKGFRSYGSTAAAWADLTITP